MPPKVQMNGPSRKTSVEWARTIRLVERDALKLAVQLNALKTPMHYRCQRANLDFRPLHEVHPEFAREAATSAWRASLASVSTIGVAPCLRRRARQPAPCRRPVGPCQPQERETISSAIARARPEETVRTGTSCIQFRHFPRTPAEPARPAVRHLPAPVVQDSRRHCQIKLT